MALLTGSKNALKGAGFFLGGALLGVAGFRCALLVLVAGLAVSFTAAALLLPRDLGRPKVRPALRGLFARQREINWLAAARFFLFGARDLWFVIGLPVYLSSVLGWGHATVGAFLALRVIGYGSVRAAAPRVLARGGRSPDGATAAGLTATLALCAAALALALARGAETTLTLVLCLTAFGAVLALDSAAHSYLILAYTGADKAAVDVGFYYAANAGGRLAGTLLSGWTYQVFGLPGCLWGAGVFLLAATLLSLPLPRAGPRFA